PRPRRKLWATALIPSFLIVAAVSAWHAAQSPDSSLSLRRILSATWPAPTPAPAPALAAIAPPAPAGAITIRASAPKDATSTASNGSEASSSSFALLIPLGQDCFTFLRKQPQ